MMMNYVNIVPGMNIASQLAEDVGAPELRNPLNAGMRGKGLFNRFFSLLTKASR